MIDRAFAQSLVDAAAKLRKEKDYWHFDNHGNKFIRFPMPDTFGVVRTTLDGVILEHLDEAYRMNEEIDLRAVCQEPRGSKTQQGRL